YNWYETDTLRPLLPTYVSTVDSGNLAGHLITLSSTLSEWAEKPHIFFQSNREGLSDVLAILEETVREIPDHQPSLHSLRQKIEGNITRFHDSVFTFIEQENTIPSHVIDLSLAAHDIVHLVGELDHKIQTIESARALSWAKCLIDTCNAYHYDATAHCDTEKLRKKLNRLAIVARQIAFDMKFDFLEQPKRHLLSIGYRVQENKLDENCYDLLASEARLASFFAIAKGDIKLKHWFRLGRLLVPIGGKGALLSWSGSMFEYLMPSLIMHEPLGSLL
ncbi:hypothetical protein, partial [Bartonella sp. MU70NMGDW]|uniref:hypothetical protein n=1 Tax=Bartonella sp. MU70NMGDW TaxID=3243561 RepID=UPI0035D105C4